jgi:hypothetical protein
MKVNGRRIEVHTIRLGNPHKVIGCLVDDSEQKRPSTPFEIDTYPKFLVDPNDAQRILQELGRRSATEKTIKLRYPS